MFRSSAFLPGLRLPMSPDAAISAPRRATGQAGSEVSASPSQRAFSLIDSSFDPLTIPAGGYGALTITKSISIMAEGIEGSVLVSGTNGIVIAAGANDVVNLRGLSFEGLEHSTGTAGINGISFTSGAALHISNCVIHGFGQNGISFTPSASAGLFVSDCVIADNGQAGIHVAPTGGNAEVNVVRVQSENNYAGLRAVSSGGMVDFTATDSIATHNVGGGFAGDANSGAVQMMLQHVGASFNAIGVATNAASSTVWLGNSSVTANSNTGCARVCTGHSGMHGNPRVSS